MLGLDWMKHLGNKKEIIKTSLKNQNIQEDPHKTELKRKFKKLFHENTKVKGIEVDIQVKPDAQLLPQKSRSISIHQQPAVGKKRKTEERRPNRKSDKQK